MEQLRTARNLQLGSSRITHEIPAALYLILFAGVMLVCAPCVYAKVCERIRRRDAERPFHTASARTATRDPAGLAAAEALSPEFLDATFRQMRESMLHLGSLLEQTNVRSSGSGAYPLGMTRENRKEYIDNVLKIKRVSMRDCDADEELGSSSDAPKGEDNANNNNKASSAHDDEDTLVLASSHDNNNNDNVECCAICMDSYNDGEAVGWSHNDHCTHYFHKDCIHEWLMKNEECPICRNLYLAFADDENDNDDNRTTTNDNSNRRTLNSAQRQDLEQTMALAHGLELFYQLSRRGLRSFSSPAAAAQTGSDEVATSANNNNNNNEDDDLEMTAMTTTPNSTQHAASIATNDDDVDG